MSKPRMGRPPVAAAAKRTARITVYLTEEELSALRRRAEGAGLRLAVYCRQALLGVRLSSRVNQTARRELRRIGNNLNQLAYRANATGRLGEWHALKSVLDAIRVKLEEL